MVVILQRHININITRNMFLWLYLQQFRGEVEEC